MELDFGGYSVGEVRTAAKERDRSGDGGRPGERELEGSGGVAATGDAMSNGPLTARGEFFDEDMVLIVDVRDPRVRAGIGIGMGIVSTAAMWLGSWVGRVVFGRERSWDNAVALTPCLGASMSLSLAVDDLLGARALVVEFRWRLGAGEGEFGERSYSNSLERSSSITTHCSSAVWRVTGEAPRCAVFASIMVRRTLGDSRRRGDSRSKLDRVGVSGDGTRTVSDDNTRVAGRPLRGSSADPDRASVLCRAANGVASSSLRENENVEPSRGDVGEWILSDPSVELEDG